jgi:hypothetical protein
MIKKGNLSGVWAVCQYHTGTDTKVLNLFFGEGRGHQTIRNVCVEQNTRFQ